MTDRPHSPHSPQEKIRLDKDHRWVLYAVTALVWFSGLFWLGVEKWIGQGGSDWAPLFLKTHGAAAMVFSIILGSLLVHVRKGLALDRNKFFGLLLLGICLFLVATGWMLYYLGNEDWRKVTSFAHWTVGLSLPFILVLHILVGRKKLKIKGIRG